MNATFHFMLRAVRRTGVAAATAALVAAAVSPVFAAPGAHGPNGEHLDEKASLAAGAVLPRVEAKSELFELVAQLKGGELSILVDRYVTNEPVLAAKLDVESGALKAAGSFRSESGDYVVRDPALMKALSTPGEHALVFTVVAGQDADLLDGTLVTVGAPTATPNPGHGHSNGYGDDRKPEFVAWISAGAAVLSLIAGVAWWRRRRRAAMSVATVAKGERS